MLLTQNGETYKYKKKQFAIGGGVQAVGSDYKGLYGAITEIRDGDDKRSTAKHPELYCNFFRPLNKELETIVARKRSKYFGEKVKFEDLPLNHIIMSPSALRSTKRCRIYRAEHEYQVDRMNAAVQCDVYRVIFDGGLETDDLEEIFYVLNCRPPNNFAAGTLKTSDVVELYDKKNSTFFLCSEDGFIPIPFEPVKNERCAYV